MELPSERVAIYIDGGNLYQRLKEAGVSHPGRFNYTGLIDLLTRGRTLVSKAYYVGIVRNFDQTQKSQTLVERQQKFLGKLEAAGLSIKRGRIVYDHKIREKGVDVHLAIDLIVGAVENLYDTAIIVSSDTDLIPAVRYIREKGKSVEYAGFAAKPSLGMARESTLSVLLRPEEIEAMAEGDGQGGQAEAA
jgi:uncharacterized LabA/DUF88 family protein